MKRFIATFACLISVHMVTGVSYAAPQNLAHARKAVIAYHDSGEYDKDFTKVAESALAYLKLRDKNPKNPAKKLAIVLDIDETSLSNYEDMARLNFGGTPEQIRAYEMKAHDKPLEPTLALYNYAIAHHLAVIFITGRHIEEKEATIKNLKDAGFKQWDKIVFRDGAYKKAPAAKYKATMRKDLTDQGYQIVLNLGDQVSDLAGGYSERTYKLPNPFYIVV